MDILLLILIVLLVLSLGGWGYGYYGRSGRVADADVVAAPAFGGNLLGILAVIAVVLIVLMLLTNWRPLGPVF
jgi:hypothetical protein